MCIFLGIFCKETNTSFAVKLRRFIYTFFNDVLKFFGTRKVKISGTTYSLNIVAFKKSSSPAILLGGNEKNANVP